MIHALERSGLRDHALGHLTQRSSGAASANSVKKAKLSIIDRR
jgi:hypothetical protein